MRLYAPVGGKKTASKFCFPPKNLLEVVPARSLDIASMGGDFDFHLDMWGPDSDREAVMYAISQTGKVTYASVSHFACSENGASDAQGMGGDLDFHLDMWGPDSDREAVMYAMCVDIAE